MSIRAVTVIALVASAIRIDGDALADFETGHFRSDLVDLAYKLVSESQTPVPFTGERSLKDTRAASYFSCISRSDF